MDHVEPIDVMEGIIEENLRDDPHFYDDPDFTPPPISEPLPDFGVQVMYGETPKRKHIFGTQPLVSATYIPIVSGTYSYVPLFGTTPGFTTTRNLESLEQINDFTRNR